MISDSERAFKEGYLFFPPHGVLGQLKKSWQKKYCQLFRASKYGIERLEIFESEDDTGKTSSIPIITLENCVKITQVKDAQKQQANVFTVVTKSVAHHFAATSEADMLEWITAFQTVAFKDNVSRQTIEEDNDLYCSSGDAGIFSVRLVSSEASEKCGLKPGPYTLVVTPSALQLRDVSEQAILFTWPYRFIRRYGYRAGKFTFEAGRKCESGEGTFHMEHSNQQEIFRCISSKMKNMRKLLTGDSLPAIFCGDNQFNAALSMSARSRSPLPPSPTSATSPLLDSDLVHISSVKPLMPVVLDSHEPKPASRNVNNPPLLKPKPEKPPRKNVPVKPSICSNPPPIVSQPPPFADPRRNIDSDQDTSAYDDVEIRNEAWRTMGIDVMTHTERPFSTDESGKVFIQQTSCNDYDRLQHLGPVSKSNPCPGYKQINAIATVASASVSMIPAEIDDEDDDDAIQAVRMADDSHLGYGMIRKKSIPVDNTLQQTSQRPRHTVHNELEYAVVCKPHKV